MSETQNERTTISLLKESYWKLAEAKVKLKCDTWDDFAEKIYELVGGNNAAGSNQ